MIVWLWNNWMLCDYTETLPDSSTRHLNIVSISSSTFGMTKKLDTQLIFQWISYFLQPPHFDLVSTNQKCRIWVRMRRPRGRGQNDADRKWLLACDSSQPIRCRWGWNEAKGTDRKVISASSWEQAKMRQKWLSYQYPLASSQPNFGLIHIRSRTVSNDDFHISTPQPHLGLMSAWFVRSSASDLMLRMMPRWGWGNTLT